MKRRGSGDEGDNRYQGTANSPKRGSAGLPPGEAGPVWLRSPSTELLSPVRTRTGAADTDRGGGGPQGVRECRNPYAARGHIADRAGRTLPSGGRVPLSRVWKRRQSKA